MFNSALSTVTGRRPASRGPSLDYDRQHQYHELKEVMGGDTSVQDDDDGGEGEGSRSRGRSWDGAPVSGPSTGERHKDHARKTSGSQPPPKPRERKSRTQAEFHAMLPSVSEKKGKMATTASAKTMDKASSNQSAPPPPPSKSNDDADIFSIALTRAQWRKLIILAFGSLVNNITYSLLAPFFPTVAKERGVSEWHVGLIFGMFALAAFVTAPYAGIALQKKRFTRLSMMIFGMVLNAFFTGLFGLLEFYGSDAENFWYLFLAYVSRIAAGVGCGLTDTSLYALIAATFHGHPQLPALMGTMESVCGLGFVGGPALGGLLYDSTSFSATMILPSAVLAGYVVLPWYFLREPAAALPSEPGVVGENSRAEHRAEHRAEAGEGGDEEEPTKPKDYEQEKKQDVKMVHLFRSFRFVCVCWSGVLANVQFGYLEATYADQAETPGSATRVGMLFAIMALVYCLLTSPVGMICTRMGLHNCLALGFVIESIGYVVLVPPESWGRQFVELPGREYAAMVINGLGAAFSYVPVYPALLKASGRENVEGVPDLVAGVTGSSFQLGNFMGPVAAGLVVSATPTYHAAIVFICVVFCVQAAVEARGLIGIKW